jgi:hypothetical protein
MWNICRPAWIVKVNRYSPVHTPTTSLYSSYIHSNAYYVQCNGNSTNMAKCVNIRQLILKDQHSQIHWHYHMKITIQLMCEIGHTMWWSCYNISAHTISAMYSTFSRQCSCEAISSVTNLVKLDWWSTTLQPEAALTKNAHCTICIELH